MTKQEGHTFRQPSPPLWSGKESLKLVRHLNERCLQLLRDAAMSKTSEPSEVTGDLELWSALDADMIRRAAGFPFVIQDVFFTDEGWWRSVTQSPNRFLDERTGTLLWPAEVAEKLLGELLVFAWHTAKWDRRVARLSLGMSPGVVEAIAALTPQQLDIVSRSNGGSLRLRWQQDLNLWARLLKAARERDEATVADIHLHAKLLLSGELIASSASMRLLA